MVFSTQGAAVGMVGSTLAMRLVGLLMIGAWTSFGGHALCAEPVPVTVSVLPLKHFVERVGGEHVRVAVMVGPGQNPHAYEPSPRQMADLAKAKVYLRIGVPFEEAWLDRIATANPALQIVDLRKGVAVQELEPKAATRHGSPPHEQDSTGGAAHRDPHIWTDPRRVEIIAQNIQETLIALDPGHRAQYEANYAEFVDELDHLDRAIRGLFENKKSRRFMVFHPAWSYFAEAYGLEQIPIEVRGREPGAKQLAGLIEQARAFGIRVIFVQPQFSRRNAATMARAIGGSVIAVDPLAENYPENLMRVAKRFAGALE